MEARHKVWEVKGRRERENQDDCERKEGTEDRISTRDERNGGWDRVMRREQRKAEGREERKDRKRNGRKKTGKDRLMDGNIEGN